MANFRKATIFAGATLALAAGVYAAVQQGTLVVDGRSTPADVRTIGGSAYVRLADVAKALDMSVVSRGNGHYELTKAGGATQIGGRAGKIGDTLFDGKWRFTVLSVDTPASYEMKTDGALYNERDTARMDPTSRVVTPGRNYALVVIRCRVSNGTKERRTLWTAVSDNRIRTAVADTDGGSHVPIGYDFSGGPTQSDILLPGAQLTFNVVFSLPADAKPQDLIFTLKNNQTSEPGTDVRIALAGK